eukprot:85736_1
MSASIELYNNYLCDLLIHGYSHKHCQVLINRDISYVCSKYIYISSNLLPWVDDYSSDYKMTEVNYLLFNHGHGSVPTPLGSSDLELIQLNKSYSECLYAESGLEELKYNLGQIKDKKLLNAITLCVDWNRSKNHLDWYRFKDYDKYLNIAIDWSKKGIDLRCKYMSKLIAMYEYYYFDLYVLKFIKQTLNAEDSTELINLLQMRINDELNGNQGIDFDEWSNYNSMKMSSLTQIIIMEHEQNVDHLMCELDNILSFVRFKYKMIRARITKAVGVEREAFIPSKTVVQIISHVVLGTLVVSWVIPTAPICIVGANCYKYMSNDPRDEIELFDNLAKYIYPWVPPNERVLDAWLP